MGSLDIASFCCLVSRATSPAHFVLSSRSKILFTLLNANAHDHSTTRLTLRSVNLSLPATLPRVPPPESQAMLGIWLPTTQTKKRSHQWFSHRTIPLTAFRSDNTFRSFWMMGSCAQALASLAGFSWMTSHLAFSSITSDMRALPAAHGTYTPRSSCERTATKRLDNERRASRNPHPKIFRAPFIVTDLRYK